METKNQQQTENTVTIMRDKDEQGKLTGTFTLICNGNSFDAISKECMGMICEGIKIVTQGDGKSGIARLTLTPVDGGVVKMEMKSVSEDY